MSVSNRPKISFRIAASISGDGCHRYSRAYRFRANLCRTSTTCLSLSAITGSNVSIAVGSRTGAVPLRPVSSPRHVKRSVRISRTTLSCRLHPKGYGTYQAGSTFTTGSTVPRNPNTNQGLGISNPYSTCSSRSLCVFALASDAAVSSSQPSPSRRQNTDWNAQPENS